MFANTLLDAYKQAKNYVQDKQIAHDLNLSKQQISNIRHGLRYLSDKEALFLCEGAKIDPHEALIYLAADRAKDCKAKQIWQDITAKLNSQGFQQLSLSIVGFLALDTSTIKYALCILC
ncbi:DUF3693 domain-containing protein [Grimontia hollisae]|uniref:DUF3693 domain-containing protein n=1 Tax=Grimontia hollisae TaxID=673 RepID=UPI0023DB9FF2|nr:DUF3693 domain-containing protein [Grimontia hollisae]MDF2186298.1 DUF3693 domain-containing protein [Grimontia hollisae]